MQQPLLFGVPITGRIVNVASVTHRSPFRYPGGKTWLVPYIRQWFQGMKHPPTLMVEPFAGGGIVSLSALFEGMVDRIVMVELDAAVAAVWKTIFSEEGEWLAQRIISFDLTQANVEEVLDNPSGSLRDEAFKVLLRNRTNHGGIMAPGSGRIKHGENGKGLASRWYPVTLHKRILDLARLRSRVTFIQGDGIEAMRLFTNDKSAVFFIDPPYTMAGKRAGTRLYTHNELDHEELFRVTAQVKGDFLMTYDNTAEVSEMANRHGFVARSIPMKNTHHTEMTELLIGRDLSWL